MSIVNMLFTASNCSYRASGCPKVVCFGFRQTRWYVVVFFFFANSSVITAFVADTTLQIGTNTPYGVRYVACHVQVALLSFLGPSWSQLCSDWYALGCSAGAAFGCVCLSHVSGWLRCSLQFHFECIVFCRAGSGDTLWPVRTLERRQVVSSRHPATSGRRVIRARLVLWRSGASGMGAYAVDKKSTFFWCQENKSAPLLAAVKGLNDVDPPSAPHSQVPWTHPLHLTQLDLFSFILA